MKTEKKNSLFLFGMICGILAFINVGTPCWAQNNRSFLDNTYAGINIGANTPLSFNDFNPFNTAISIRAGKNISPITGFFVEGGFWVNGATSHSLDFSKNGISNVSVLLGNTIDLLSLTEASRKKNESRLFGLSTVLALGWAHIYGSADHNELVSKTGLDLNFNLGKSKNYQVFIEPAINWNLTPHIYNDAIQFHKQHAYLQLAIGFNYKFGKISNNKKPIHSEMRPQINRPIQFMPARIDTIIVNDTVLVSVPNKNQTTVIYFAEGKSELTSFAKTALDNIANTQDVAFEIRGYASETGTKHINDKLAEARANTVADYLRSKNCCISSVSSYGNTSQPVARVVIVTNK